MKLVAIILALFVAFPNMGYALVNDCCSHEQVVESDCGEDTLALQDHGSDQNDDHPPCPSQCDCSCCVHIFLIADEIEVHQNINQIFSQTSPLSRGTSFSLGFYNLIWQPPQLV